MLELKPLDPKPDRPVLEGARSESSVEPKQRRAMVIALVLLLVALGFVLYHDRDFWFPDADQAQELEGPPAQSNPVAASSGNAANPARDLRSHGAIPKRPLANDAANPPGAASPDRVSRNLASGRVAPTSGAPSTQPSHTGAQSAAASSPAASSTDAPPVAVERTALPPLDVEVVAGDVHRTIRPGGNSVHVELQPGAVAQAQSAPAVAEDSPATVTHNASEQVQMSADTADVVSRPVKPGYPLLARQMRVQGSVILQALINKDGTIQDLHVMSGPPILADAAREAVRQWHFKPHYQGADMVETQAKITVNFTISTN